MMRVMDGRQRAARAVAARRGELDMTQQDLAGAAKVDAKTIWNLETKGRWPIARTRTRIEKALGWAAGELDRIAAESREDELAPRDDHERFVMAHPGLGRDDKRLMIESYRRAKAGYAPEPAPDPPPAKAEDRSPGQAAAS